MQIELPIVGNCITTRDVKPTTTEGTLDFALILVGMQQETTEVIPEKGVTEVICLPHEEEEINYELIELSQPSEIELSNKEINLEVKDIENIRVDTKLYNTRQVLKNNIVTEDETDKVIQTILHDTKQEKPVLLGSPELKMSVEKQQLKNTTQLETNYLIGKDVGTEINKTESVDTETIKPESIKPGPITTEPTKTEYIKPEHVETAVTHGKINDVVVEVKTIETSSENELLKSEVIAQVNETVKLTVQTKQQGLGEIKTVTMQLKPEKLGELNIEIRRELSGIKINILTENREVAKLLAENSEELLSSVRKFTNGDPVIMINNQDHQNKDYLEHNKGGNNSQNQSEQQDQDSREDDVSFSELIRGLGVKQV